MPSIDFRLYLVTDRRQITRGTLLSVLAQFIAAGGRAVQLRERDLDTRELLDLARAVGGLCESTGTKLWINDRADLAVVTNAAGVHLRETSLPVPAARRIVGCDRLIGVSTHSVDGATEAERLGADFLVLGPIYDTPSKREYGPPLGLRVLERACSRVRIPVFAIGGMTAERASQVRSAGAFGLAVSSYILGASDAAGATRELLHALEHAHGRPS